jgi:hypothetical protein
VQQHPVVVAVLAQLEEMPQQALADQAALDCHLQCQALRYSMLVEAVVLVVQVVPVVAHLWVALGQQMDLRPALEELIEVVVAVAGMLVSVVLADLAL